MLSLVRYCAIVAVIATLGSQARGVTVQTAANVFHGRPYLWLEAENFASVTDGGTAGNGWKVVSKQTPITSNQGAPILPAASNVSGTALLDDIGGGGHEDTVLYEVKFITPGTYQLFTRHSMYDSDGNGNVGNEDSVYLSPAFNKNSSSDWVGFQGLNFDEGDPTVDIPTPGFAADPDGWKPATADSANDGWYALRDWGVKSAGTPNFSNAISSGLFNGNFNWYNRPFFVDTNSAGSFTSDYGAKTEYTVTPEMVGQTLTFEMGNREQYGIFDGFLFIQTSNIYPDQDLLDLYTQADLDAILQAAPGVQGDYNGNGTVDAADYVAWRKGGTLVNEVDTPGTVNAADYTAWRARFGNTTGSGLGASAIPEPATSVLLLLSFAAYPFNRRRKGL